VNSDALRGIYPAIVTPITAHGEVVVEVAVKLLQRLLAAGVDGVYVGGSTGEGMKLSLDNRERLVECLMDALPGDKKVLVHVGAPRIEDAVRLAAHAAKAGAHAISSLPPQGTAAKVFDYYKLLAGSSSVPLILYYFPEASPEAFQDPEDLEKVCALRNVSAVKFTDYNLFLLERLAMGGTLVYNGRDEVLAAGLLMGAGGGIGSTYNLVPDLYVALYQHALAGEWEHARELQKRINRLIGVLLRYPFLPALKAALEDDGLPCGPTLNGQRFEGAAQRREFLSEFMHARDAV
jgi:N-acetylneuraminate lyase